MDLCVRTVPLSLLTSSDVLCKILSPQDSFFSQHTVDPKPLPTTVHSHRLRKSSPHIPLIHFFLSQGQFLDHSPLSLFLDSTLRSRWHTIFSEFLFFFTGPTEDTNPFFHILLSMWRCSENERAKQVLSHSLVWLSSLALFCTRGV